MGRKALIVLFISALLPSVIWAQNYPFEVYGLEDGLPQSQVTCIIQDREGYIWVGTRVGLTRFNGERFTSYYHQDGLPSSRIQRMLVDRQGVLWVATESGLAKWQGHHLSRVNDEALAAVRCRALAEDGRGRLWVGTDRGLVIGRAGAFAPVGEERGQSLGTVYDLIADGAGVVGVSDQGVFQAAADRSAAMIPGPAAPQGSLRSICRTDDGLWVGTRDQGLFLGSGGIWAPVPASRVRARNSPGLFVSAAGTLYIASRDAGLLRRERGQKNFEELNAGNGLPSNMVNCAFEDNQGNLWVGTDLGGLARLRSAAVRNYLESDGLPDNCVFGISPALAQNEAWLCTMFGAVRCRVDGEFQVLERIGVPDGLADDHVWEIAATPRGDLWVMTDNDYHRRRAGQSRFERLPRTLAIPHQAIFGLTLDLQGRVWLYGTDPVSCLAVCDADDNWRSWSACQDGKPLLRCRSVVPRRAGGVWVAAGSRILFSDGQSLAEMSDTLSVPPRANIDVLCEDRGGRLWAGWEGGLAVHDPARGWRPIKNEPDYNFSQIYFIGEDARGTIWVGVSKGVLRVTPSGQLKPFFLADGLAGSETNQGGFYNGPDGSVWVGTVDGVSRIDLGRLENPAPPPPVIIEAVELPGRTIGFPQTLDLGYAERSVTFRVAVLSYRGGPEDTFRSRLQGMEDDWLPSRRGAGIRYTNIPPGVYTLQVQPAVGNGGWGPSVNVPVNVRTPFWLTWWFRLAAVAFLLLIAAGVFLWRTRILRQRALDLERTVAERTEELVAANEELERLATHDPLTGLWNRRAILDRLDEACRLSFAAEGRQPLGIILVDLDDFKRVNDELGHVAGDLVLRDVAVQIEAQTREQDSVGRYGGDEFLAILPGTDRAAIEAVVRRIAGVRYEAQVEGKSVTVTASCGALTVSGEAAFNEVVVLAQADELLYQAKNSGKHSYRTAVLGKTPLSR